MYKIFFKLAFLTLIVGYLYMQHLTIENLKNRNNSLIARLQSLEIECKNRDIANSAIGQIKEIEGSYNENINFDNNDSNNTYDKWVW